MAGLEPEALLDLLDLPLRIRLLEEDPDESGTARVPPRARARGAAGTRRRSPPRGGHARAARAVEALRGAAQPAQIARHYLAGPRTDGPLAVEWARRAAAAALAADRFDETARWLEKALQAHRHRRGRCRRSCCSSSARPTRARQPEQAQASCREAMAAARGDGDAELLARAALAFAGRRITASEVKEHEEVAALQEDSVALATDSLACARNCLRASRSRTT